MALRKRSRLRKPRAVYFSHWILALMLSERALVMPWTTAVTHRGLVRKTRSLRAADHLGLKPD